jgi:hypothetical protein
MARQSSTLWCDGARPASITIAARPSGLVGRNELATRGKRRDRTISPGVYLERLAGDFEPQILGDRNAQHKLAADLLFRTRQLHVAQLQQRFGGIYQDVLGVRAGRALTS